MKKVQPQPPPPPPGPPASAAAACIPSTCWDTCLVATGDNTILNVFDLSSPKESRAEAMFTLPGEVEASCWHARKMCHFSSESDDDFSCFYASRSDGDILKVDVAALPDPASAAARPLHPDDEGRSYPFIRETLTGGRRESWMSLSRCFCSVSSTLVAQAFDGSALAIHDVRKKKVISWLEKAEKASDCFSVCAPFETFPNTIFASGDDGTVAWIDLKTKKLLHNPRFCGSFINSLRMSFSHGYLCLASGSSDIKVVELPNMNVVQETRLGGGPSHCIVSQMVSWDGNYICSNESSGHVRISDIRVGVQKELARAPATKDWMYGHCQVSADSFAVAGNDSRVSVCNFMGKVLWTRLLKEAGRRKGCCYIGAGPRGESVDRTRSHELDDEILRFVMGQDVLESCFATLRLSAAQAQVVEIKVWRSTLLAS